MKTRASEDEILCAVRAETRALLLPLPDWLADYNTAVSEPSDALDRRSWERMERLERQSHQGQHERTRDRVARERTRPWDQHASRGIRKRLWQEQRDAERVVLDRRETTLQELDQQVAHYHVQWLAELLTLDPRACAWCDEQTRRRECAALTPDDLAQLWQRRRAAAATCAHNWLAQPGVQAALEATGIDGMREPVAIAITITPVLVHLDEISLPRLPIVFAALAIALIWPLQGSPRAAFAPPIA